MGPGASSFSGWMRVSVFSFFAALAADAQDMRAPHLHSVTAVYENSFRVHIGFWRQDSLNLLFRVYRKDSDSGSFLRIADSVEGKGFLAEQLFIDYAIKPATRYTYSIAAFTADTELFSNSEPIDVPAMGPVYLQPAFDSLIWDPVSKAIRINFTDSSAVKPNIYGGLQKLVFIMKSVDSGAFRLEAKPDRPYPPQPVYRDVWIDKDVSYGHLYRYRLDLCDDKTIVIGQTRDIFASPPTVSIKAGRSGLPNGKGAERTGEGYLLNGKRTLKRPLGRRRCISCVDSD